MTASLANAPEISVIMPVHNGAAFVERAIETVRKQTFSSWELLAFDDGSADDSLARLRQQAVVDPRIRVWSRPRTEAGPHGPGSARNQALHHARGRMVAYLDHDDEYYPDYLSHVHAWRPYAKVLIFAYDQVDHRPQSDDYGQIRLWDPSPFWTRLPEQHIAVPLGVAHRREVLDTVGFFDESDYLSLEEDADMWRRMAKAGFGFLFLPLKSGRYHIRPDSLSRRRAPTRSV